MFRHNKYIGMWDNSKNIYSHLMVINVINNTILKGVSLLFFFNGIALSMLTTKFGTEKKTK